MIQTLRMPLAVGADVATVRVRHFTSVGNLAKIQEGNIVLAGDHGCVFAVSARGQPPSPRTWRKPSEFPVVGGMHSSILTRFRESSRSESMP